MHQPSHKLPLPTTQSRLSGYKRQLMRTAGSIQHMKARIPEEDAEQSSTDDEWVTRGQD